jgi:hypothetical protein
MSLNSVAAVNGESACGRLENLLKIDKLVKVHDTLKGLNHLIETVSGQQLQKSYSMGQILLATLKNRFFAQTLRCEQRFYPRHISYMPAVKSSSAP